MYAIRSYYGAKKSCRRCERMVQPAAPSRPIPGSMAGPGLLAQILVSKFDDHIPFYRQNEIYARMGADIPDSTLLRITSYNVCYTKLLRDDRRVLSGIIFINRNGLRWCDAPREYGPAKTLYNRWKRWSDNGVFARIMMGLAAESAERQAIMIDATYLKAHRTASSLCVKKGGASAR